MRKFPFAYQLDSVDCGPTCLQMICRYYGKIFFLQTLREKSGIGKQGVSLLGISEAAESMGFRTLAVNTSVDKIKKEAILPLIAHWKQSHFIIIYKVVKDKFFIADPAAGLVTLTKKELEEIWINNSINSEGKNAVLLLEPTPSFFNQKGDSRHELNFRVLFEYLFKYKKLLLQLVLSIFLASILQLIFPFLTQSVVDVGINTKDVRFIFIILLAQLMLYFGQTSVEFMRNWILLHINTRVNISVLTDFLIKLMKLPIAFFDGKGVGDILQRINDQQRIQDFLTGPGLNILFSSFNLVIFGVVIVHYDFKIFLIFFTGSVLYIIWVTFFWHRRNNLDYKRFSLLSENQSNLIHLIYGMQEIKMNNCETSKRWKWERIQAKVFNISVKSLQLNQIQQGGSIFINQIKNILITYFSAMAVVEGKITLGAMLAIQYIIGQLNSPLEHFIQFIQSTQDALISMARMNEISNLEDEDPENTLILKKFSVREDIRIENLNFKYRGVGNELVLKNITLTIPFGKTTAIVGMSGSGKTTLLKLLMKFYTPTEGSIFLGINNLEILSNKVWRSNCGSVLQDGYIFSDTLSSNIVVNEDDFDLDRLTHASKIANLVDLIDSLPLGFDSQIGVDGLGLSQGQKQRILIARAIYKNPNFIFLDEATNALDSINENNIMSELNSFFYGKTLIIAAHRLSTVKNADQIVVLNKGEIVEKGNHEQLMSLKGYYNKLIKNQLVN